MNIFFFKPFPLILMVAIVCFANSTATNANQMEKSWIVLVYAALDNDSVAPVNSVTMGNFGQCVKLSQSH